MVNIHEFLRRPFDRFDEWRLRRAYARWQKTNAEFEAAIDRLAATVVEFSKFAEDFGKTVDQLEASMPQYRQEKP